jgi:hypothetical protein
MNSLANAVLAAASVTFVPVADSPNQALMDDAKVVAREVFFELCGSRGEYCGIAIGPSECEREFILSFPINRQHLEARGHLWVTLDQHRNVIWLSLTREGRCRGENGGRVAT